MTKNQDVPSIDELLLLTWKLGWGILIVIDPKQFTVMKINQQLTFYEEFSWFQWIKFRERYDKV